MLVIFLSLNLQPCLRCVNGKGSCNRVQCKTIIISSASRLCLCNVKTTSKLCDLSNESAATYRTLQLSMQHLNDVMETKIIGKKWVREKLRDRENDAFTAQNFVDITSVNERPPISISHSRQQTSTQIIQRNSLCTIYTYHVFYCDYTKCYCPVRMSKCFFRGIKIKIERKIVSARTRNAIHRLIVWKDCTMCCK